ncbi:hypothetical protein BSLG_008941 [Batrachochytrium salamandrivorans]|nr:hypothetical protein BSLG_008941 [Batrachochytrium salamandrivorans]
MQYNTEELVRRMKLSEYKSMAAERERLRMALVGIRQGWESHHQVPLAEVEQRLHDEWTDINAQMEDPLLLFHINDKIHRLARKKRWKERHRIKSKSMHKKPSHLTIDPSKTDEGEEDLSSSENSRVGWTPASTKNCRLLKATCDRIRNNLKIIDQLRELRSLDGGGRHVESSRREHQTDPTVDNTPCNSTKSHQDPFQVKIELLRLELLHASRLVSAASSTPTAASKRNARSRHRKRLGRRTRQAEMSQAGISIKNMINIRSQWDACIVPPPGTFRSSRIPFGQIETSPPLP